MAAKNMQLLELGLDVIATICEHLNPFDIGRFSMANKFLYHSRDKMDKRISIPKYRNITILEDKEEKLFLAACEDGYSDIVEKYFYPSYPDLCVGSILALNAKRYAVCNRLFSAVVFALDGRNKHFQQWFYTIMEYAKNVKDPQIFRIVHPSIRTMPMDIGQRLMFGGYHDETLIPQEFYPKDPNEVLIKTITYDNVDLYNKFRHIYCQAETNSNDYQTNLNFIKSQLDKYIFIRLESIKIITYEYELAKEANKLKVFFEWLVPLCRRAGSDLVSKLVKSNIEFSEWDIADMLAHLYLKIFERRSERSQVGFVKKYDKECGRCMCDIVKQYSATDNELRHVYQNIDGISKRAHKEIL